MTKYSFLNQLDQLLSELEANERKEILEDYEEHFAFAKRADKSDADVIALVGTPMEIANEILANQVTGNSYEEVRINNEVKVELLEAQAASLYAQAASLEEQAELLEEQAELLEEQAEFLEDQEKQIDVQEKIQGDTFASQVENLVESFTATVGSAVESISEAIIENPLENAVQSSKLIEEIVDVTGVKNIVIKAKNQKVNIGKTAYSTARVRLTKGMLTVKVEGDTLYIEARDLKTKRKLGIGTLINMEPTAELEIKLPEIVYELIQAKTSNAKIKIGSFNINKLDLETVNDKLEVLGITANELKLRTTNDKVEVQNSKGHIDAQTTNGKIELMAIDGTVYAKTTNSKIKLGDITGAIKANTVNGKIEFNNKTINQHVTLTTTNAKIEVSLQSKPENAKFKLSTSNAETKLFGKNSSYDEFGDGMHVVTISTTNGKVEVG